MKDIDQNDSGSGEFADTPTSAPGTKRSSRLPWFRDSRMSSNGRKCEYRLLDVNGHLCCIDEVQLKCGKVALWPVAPLAGPAKNRFSMASERQLSGQHRTFLR